MKKSKEYKGITLPKGISNLTNNFIKNLIDTFDQEKKLNSLDSLSIYLLASNLDQYLEAEKEIKKNGLVVITDRGNQALSPYAQIQKSLMKDIISLLKELGLTLGSRAKIKVLDNPDENNPLLNFLKDD